MAKITCIFYKVFSFDNKKVGIVFETFLEKKILGKKDIFVVCL